MILGNASSVWDQTGRLLHELARRVGRGPYTGHSIAFIGDGLLITPPAVTSAEPGWRQYALSIWDIAGGTVAKSIKGPEPDGSVWQHNWANAFDVSRDQSLAATVSTSGQRITLYSARTWQVLWTIEVTARDGFVDSIDISPDGQFIAAGFGSNYVKIFATSTGALVRAFVAFEPPYNALAGSHQSRWYHF